MTEDHDQIDDEPDLVEIEVLIPRKQFEFMHIARGEQWFDDVQGAVSEYVENECSTLMYRLREVEGELTPETASERECVEQAAESKHKRLPVKRDILCPFCRTLFAAVGISAHIGRCYVQRGLTAPEAAAYLCSHPRYLARKYVLTYVTYDVTSRPAHRGQSALIAVQKVAAALQQMSDGQWGSSEYESLVESAHGKLEVKTP